MGGNKEPGVPNLKTPSIGDLYSEAVSANINELPRILEAYGKYGPQYQSIQRQLFPEQFGVQAGLGQELTTALSAINQGGGGALPETLRTPALSYLRGAQAARGMAESPVSAMSEMKYLGELGENYRQNITSSGINFMNATPAGGEMNLDTIGLKPAGMEYLTGANQTQYQLNNETDLVQYGLDMQKYQRDQEKKNAQWKMLGQIGGGAVGGYFGGPAGAEAGAAVGGQLGQLGGTYF